MKAVREKERRGDGESGLSEYIDVEFLNYFAAYSE